MKTRPCRTVVICALFLLSALPGANAQRYVDAGATGSNSGLDWANAYTNLQHALAQAGSGTNLWIAKGTYYPTNGSDRTATFQMKAGVNLYGGFTNGMASLAERDWLNYPTILSGDIDGNNVLDANNSYHVITAVAGVTVDGMQIRDGYANGTTPDHRGGGVYAGSSAGGFAVLNSVFLNNFATADGNHGGAALSADSAVTISNCVFAAHPALASGIHGVALSNGDSAVLNCLFIWNGVSIVIRKVSGTGAENPVISNCTFALRRGLVLKNNVELVGAGMDKTILEPARRVIRLDLTRDSPDAEMRFHVDHVPDMLQPGCAVVLWRSYPPGHAGYQRPAWVEEIDRGAKTLRLATPYGLPGGPMKPGKQCLSVGAVLALERPVAKGDTEVHLKNASMFRPGDELAIGQPHNDSRDRQVFVKALRGNTLVLKSPARSELKAWEGKGWLSVTQVAWALHPCVHGWDVTNAALRDLTIRGHGFERIRPAMTRYTLSGIHLYNAQRCVIERVAVRDWASDGFSLQTGEAVRVLDCEATGNLGNGFHPGTSLKDSLFENCLAEANGTGLYFCWHNRGHVIRQCRLLNNRGGGITGLGNPGDRNNTIEQCVIAGNGTVGIGINGGGKSGNVIRGNVIENNSRAEAGKHPAIALFAANDPAQAYTIEGNTIRDTQDEPTQHTGIEEQSRLRKDKANLADHNMIRDNTYAGMETDVIARGADTVVEEADTARIVRDIQTEETLRAKAEEQGKER